MTEQIEPVSVANANAILSAALGIATPNTAIATRRAPRPAPSLASQDKIEDDADYARENTYDLVEKGAEAIDQIMEIARESQHPRAFEVLAQLLKTQSDNVDKLLKIQKERKELKKEDPAAPGSNTSITNNTVFVGTPDELIRLIRKDALTALGQERIIEGELDKEIL
jgi:hypothetical protein